MSRKGKGEGKGLRTVRELQQSVQEQTNGKQVFLISGYVLSMLLRFIVPRQSFFGASRHQAADLRNVLNRNRNPGTRDLESENWKPESVIGNPES